MIGDLHCHTRLSDGSMSIDDLVFYAKRAGLDFIAATDHDTMDGVTRATVVGRRYGIGVVPGVELSCWDGRRGRKAHLLCYLPDKPDRLQGLMQRTLDSRTKAGHRMIRAVMRYYPVTEEHILRHATGSKAVYKPHIIQALMDLGYESKPFGDLYHLLFGRDGLCRYPTDYPEVREALELVHSAGGVAVMAHPKVYDSMDLLAELAEEELLHGVEVYHPSVDAACSREIAGLADRYGLLKTGGSDFHGMLGATPRPLATRITEEADLRALFAAKKKPIRK